MLPTGWILDKRWWLLCKVEEKFRIFERYNLKNYTINIQIYDTRMLMGEAAAKETASIINQLLEIQPEINMVFAAAPSQQEFLHSLLQKAVDWKRINAFHMDEYVGLSSNSPQSFAFFLEKKLFAKLPFKSVHFLDGIAGNPAGECKRYAALLKQFPTDIVCMGIGENNHIAFNDPPVADFNDPEMVKIVTLDQACRRQQVNDSCFISLAEVPERALTLTIPALINSRYIVAIVPGERKAKALFHTLHSPVSEQYPSTILRNHPALQLFADRDSSRLL